MTSVRAPGKRSKNAVSPPVERTRPLFTSMPMTSSPHPTTKSTSLLRLREFVWVGGCVTALATWASPPGRRRRSVHKSVEMAPRRRIGAFVYTVGLLRCCEQPWGRRSVHKSAEMASRGRFGAFVYTVATRVAIRIATRAAPGGTSASTATACRRHPLAGPSRLVGKTGSERVAPLPGWHLRRGVNPHEPLKSLIARLVAGPRSRRTGCSPF